MSVGSKYVVIGTGEGENVMYLEHINIEGEVSYDEVAEGGDVFEGIEVGPVLRALRENEPEKEFFPVAH